MQFDQRQTQTSDYEVKTYSGSLNNYNMLQFQQSVQNQNKEKLESFKKRAEEFQNISTLQEAKELAQKIMPMKTGRTMFNLGEAKCTIINEDNLFRICINSPKEFICYDFV